MIRLIFFRVLLFFGIILTILSCASTGNPSGGPKDETAPGIVGHKSDQNFQVNYFPDKIELVFDEWIELKNASKQVIISPPMIKPPRFKGQGKKVTIDFENSDTLRENATYTINFGEAIVDFREGNILKNYSYVFSTGDFIDSLSVEGSITDAYTKELVPEMLVMLYDNLEDSAFYKERPFYFSRTDENGNFKIDFIKSDTFRLVALMDGNLNYRFDNSSESIAFLDTIFELHDSTLQLFELESFTERGTPIITEKDSDYKNLLSFQIEEKTDSFNFRFLNEVEHVSVWADDTLKIWYRNIQDSFLRLDILGDTLKFKEYDTKRDTLELNSLSSREGKKSKPLAPRDSLMLLFKIPVIKVEKDSIRLIDTSGQRVNFDFELDTLDPRKLYLKHRWKENVKYDLKLQPGSITDYFNRWNDTMEYRVFVSSTDKFGVINASFSDLKENQQYVLLLQFNKELITKTILDGNTLESISFRDLVPGSYRISLIQDTNRNGKWDPGNFKDKRQSEKILHFDLEELRANWELDVNITAAGLNQ